MPVRAGSLRIGCHVNRYHAYGARPSITDHIRAACEEANESAELIFGVVSIFVGGPKNRSITLHADEQAELRSFIAETQIQVIAHSSYGAHPWKGDPDAARYICEELKVCQASGITGLVVHLPKLPVSAVMRYIGRLIEPAAPNVRIYLETPAVKSSESYYETPEKIAALFSEIRRAHGDDRFGLCIDTAHLWVSDIDLASYDAADEWLAQLNAHSDVIPHDSIMIHLNDSLRERGSGPDAHAGLAMGRIWESFKGRIKMSGIAAFINYAQRYDVPVVLERKPKETLFNDYKVIRTLVPPTTRA
jgi:endonuclease IV